MDYAELGDERKVKEILEELKKNFYVDVNARGLDDWTALHFAANENNITIVKLLVENGANPNAKTTYWRTPLHMACMRGSF